MPVIAGAPDAGAVAQAAALLNGAKNIVMVIGRTSRNEKAWAARVHLAEALGTV